jgi:UDP-glucose 4-epimerase
MKVLVTGGSGFIGSNLLPVLTNRDTENSVFAVVREINKATPTNIKLISADLGHIGWTKCLPDEQFDMVIHLAQSKHYRDFPVLTDDIFKINVQATVELAQWSIKHGVKRFLFASTGNVYGNSNLVHREEDHCDPKTMYGASKFSAEILLKPFSQFIDIVVLRFFGVYGPGQTHAMLPGIIQRFKAGKEITLAENVGVRFNPIYVDDCAEMIYRLMTTVSLSAYEVINIGGEENIDLRQVSSLMENYSGINAVIRLTSERPKALVGSTEKLKQLCLYKQSTPFEIGFRRTFDSINSNARME